jgi:hypothetical protein
LAEVVLKEYPNVHGFRTISRTSGPRLLYMGSDVVSYGVQERNVLRMCMRHLHLQPTPVEDVTLLEMMDTFGDLGQSFHAVIRAPSNPVREFKPEKGLGKSLSGKLSLALKSLGSPFSQKGKKCPERSHDGNPNGCVDHHI